MRNRFRYTGHHLNRSERSWIRTGSSSRLSDELGEALPTFRGELLGAARGNRRSRVESCSVPAVLTTIAILILPILAAIGWWRLTSHTVAGGAERAVVAGIWTVLQFSGGLAILGWVGVLSAGAAISTQAIATAAVWIIPRRLNTSRDIEPVGEPQVSTAETESIKRGRFLVGIVAVGGVVAALLVLRTIWYATLLPIDGADGSTYHLPILIEALNAGQFGRPPSVWTFGWTSPKSADMAFLWLMLGRNLDLVLLGQILFLPIGVAATAALAVWAGVRRRVAWAFSATILFIPIVVVQATTAYVDIASGALFLAAIAATALYRSRKLTGGFGMLTVFAAIGLAAGSKYSFLVPSAILFVVAFWPDLRCRRITKVHALGLLVLMIGAHWYVAPVVWFGNPAWPYGMPILADFFPNYLDTVDAVVQRELTAAPALVDLPAFIRPAVVWVEAGPLFQTYTFDSRQSGLGALWFILWIPAIFGWTLIWIKERRYRDLVFLGGIIGASFLLQTYPWWTRFTWWIAALGIIATAVVYERSAERVRIAIAIVTVIGGVYVLAFTNVQGMWHAATIERLINGEEPALVAAGEAVAYGYEQHEQIIAVPGLEWAYWNTYLRGRELNNDLIVVPPGDGLVDRIRASGATMLFDPGGPIAWPGESLAALERCLEEVTTNDETGPTIYRVACP
jgi:hypothetical protein